MFTLNTKTRKKSRQLVILNALYHRQRPAKFKNIFQLLLQ